MKQSLQIGFVFIGILALILFLNLRVDKEDIDWTPSFSHKDKRPFGNYVLYNELKHWIPDSNIHLIENNEFYTTIKDTEEDDITDTSIFLNNHTPANIFLTKPRFNISELQTKQFLKFIKKGNSLFISSTSFPKHFINAIDTNIRIENIYVNNHINIKTVLSDTLIYPKGIIEHLFTLPDSNYNIYSYQLDYYKEYSPNLIQIPYGKGQIIIHNFPYALSNYYLLHENQNYKAYVEDILNLLPIQQTYWITPSLNEQGIIPQKSVLSVIYQIPQLFSAWKLLLVSLLLYLVFKAKREQRIIPVIPALKNDSKNYIKVIANLYYEEKDYLNLTHKKMRVFYDELKSSFHLDINHLTEPKTIIHKTQSSHTDVVRLLQLAKQCHLKQPFTKEEFIEFCTLADKILKS